MAKEDKSLKTYKNYRQMADELSGILEWFESSEVDIDEAVAKYEEAVQLLNQMEEYLKTAENKIHKISAKK